MLIVRFIQNLAAKACVGVLAQSGELRPLDVEHLSDLLTETVQGARRIVESPGPAVPMGQYRLLPPVDGLTEVWASGVTYRRSRQARIEESSVKDVYSLVYDAARPELFFKSVAWRVVGDGELVGIRCDSQLNVPEPELALVANAHGELFGLTICNDVSSRSIEGENPLYLPQAKIYAGACALGPGIRPIWEVPEPARLTIDARVQRNGTDVWSESTSTALMHRKFEDLLEFLYRADTFPDGAVLSTGTGLVPNLEFTLHADDVVSITIEQIGSLTNRVSVGPGDFAILSGSLKVPHLRPSIA